MNSLQYNYAVKFSTIYTHNIMHLYVCIYIYIRFVIVVDISLLLHILQFDGPKPLHLAALKGNMDVMRLLITECGCKADLRDPVRVI